MSIMFCLIVYKVFAIFSFLYYNKYKNINRKRKIMKIHLTKDYIKEHDNLFFSLLIPSMLIFFGLLFTGTAMLMPFGNDFVFHIHFSLFCLLRWQQGKSSSKESLEFFKFAVAKFLQSLEFFSSYNPYIFSFYLQFVGGVVSWNAPPLPEP